MQTFVSKCVINSFSGIRLAYILNAGHIDLWHARNTSKVGCKVKILVFFSRYKLEIT